MSEGSLSRRKTAGTLGQVKLYNNNREREMYDNLADLYAIIKTVEALEKAHLRDCIVGDQYKQTCAKLLNQFKTAQNLTQIKTPSEIKRFMQDYRLDCKAAYKRFEEGVPGASSVVDDSAKTIAETVQFFITAMDSLRLDLTAVDQVFPLLNDLYTSLCKISSLPADWSGKVAIKKWLKEMNQMQASDELDEQQVRQLNFDLDSAYTAFHKSLAGK